jgi:hypothetical protein
LARRKRKIKKLFRAGIEPASSACRADALPLYQQNLFESFLRHLIDDEEEKHTWYKELDDPIRAVSESHIEMNEKRYVPCSISCR